MGPIIHWFRVSLPLLINWLSITSLNPLKWLLVQAITNSVTFLQTSSHKILIRNKRVQRDTRTTLRITETQPTYTLSKILQEESVHQIRIIKMQIHRLETTRALRLPTTQRVSTTWNPMLHFAAFIMSLCARSAAIFHIIETTTIRYCFWRRQHKTSFRT